MRVVVADDSILLRRGVVDVLTDHGADVVAEAGNADALLDAVTRWKPDVAVTDIRMPPTQTDEGARAARTIRRDHPEVGVVLLSQIVETEHALALLGESPRGVGYLLKDRVLDAADFVQSVERVAAGGTAIDPDVVAELFGRRQAHGPLDGLTPRERDVLALMAEGRSNKGICDRLFLSGKTVESHVHNIFLKLGVGVEPDEHRRVRAVLTYLRS